MFIKISSNIWIYSTSFTNSKINKLIILEYFILIDDIFVYRLITEVSNKMLLLITEKGLNEHKAWNECSVDLTTTAKVDY